MTETPKPADKRRAFKLARDGQSNGRYEMVRRCRACGADREKLARGKYAPCEFCGPTVLKSNEDFF